MRIRIVCVFLPFLFSSASFASCGNVANIDNETLSLVIGDYCDGDNMMISFEMKGENKKGDWTEVPFISECKFHKDGNGFTCRSKGKTPLAGATYKKISFGRSQHTSDCEGGMEPVYSEPGNKYICVKGCANPRAPEFLYGDDGSC